MPTPGETYGRPTAISHQLIEIHLWLREELDRLREDLSSAGDRPLSANCVAFCSALRRHHTGEDASVFPALAEQFPELRLVIEKLEWDHQQVETILLRVEELVAEPPAPADEARVRGELDGLAAVLDSHFSYEERTLTAALNALPADPVHGDWLNHPQ